SNFAYAGPNWKGSIPALDRRHTWLPARPAVEGPRVVAGWERPSADRPWSSRGIRPLARPARPEGRPMGITAGALAWILVPVLALMARVVIVVVALRGSKPSERPAILRALADLLRPRLGRRE